MGALKNRMKNTKKYTNIVILNIVFWLFTLICWVVNLIKLLNCDFEGPWKEEAIHLIGLIGPASLITCWY